MDHSATRYLEAKRTVDDGARSTRVRDTLLAAVNPAPRILDVGCGTGTTLPHLVEWGVDAGEYRGVDSDEGVVAFAHDVRPTELDRTGWSVTPTDSGFTVEGLDAVFTVGDALAALRGANGLDLVVAHAFADLVPVEELLQAATSALSPGGLAYFPITFDGGTIFQPDHPADEAVTAAYHTAIDDQSGRDVHAGRHLIDAARRADGTTLAVAGSDWVVRPRDGSYDADEAYFLDCILAFVESALSTDDIDGADDWVATRRTQLADGRLTYVAHQYDILYRTPVS